PMELQRPRMVTDAMRLMRWPCLLGGALLLVGALLLAETGRVVLGSNFHELVPGEVFRSAQPTPALLESLARAPGLGTVINLRGRGDGMDWYDAEAAACERLGVALENFTFAATRL